jgi:hypothetical protein
MNTYVQKILIVIIFLLLLSNLLQANTVGYISPVPDSKYNNEKTNIIIGYSTRLNSSVVNSINVVVAGSASGIHTGRLFLAENNYRLIFKPDVPFALGERVTVSGIKGLDEFSFFIRNTLIVNPENYYSEAQIINSGKNTPFHVDYLIKPEDLPTFTIYNSGVTAPGNIFISNFTSTSGSANYLMILQNDGSPVYSQRLAANSFDFKKQNDNMLTYYEEMKHYYLALNSSYNIVDSFYCGNGYSTDFHEVRVMPDGSAWLMSYDVELVDMSVIVPGGKPIVNVTGLIIQKIDAEKNVVFQWRSWDYFQITDATHEDLTAYSIDYVHGNSIDVDNDGNILISSRHLDEITKINTETGNIMWRFGGKSSDFVCDNDTLGFSHQHFARRLPNGNIILFDNGNYHNPPFSRAIEYKIDEDEKTAHVIWQYRHTPDIYAFAMGSAQRLGNGNTLIGWGSASTTLTEVTPNGTVVYELSLPTQQMSYRAYRDAWGTVSGNNTDDQVIGDYKLFQNYPNPFNPSTIIRYKINKSTNVIIKIYDILGKEVSTLVNEYQKAGDYKVHFPGSNALQLPAGVYFYRLKTDDYSQVKKMILLK